MTFPQAKALIRGALAEAKDAKLVELLTDARNGKVPFMDCKQCFCGHLFGADWAADVSVIDYWDRGGMVAISDAYRRLAVVEEDQWEVAAADERRQRVLVAMVLSEIRRRTRARDIDDAETVSTIEELFVGVRC